MKGTLEIEVDNIEIDAQYNAKPRSIDELIDWLNNAKSNGATLLIYKGDSYDGESESVSISAVYHRLETDEEEAKRESELKQKEEQRLKDHKERDYQQYLRLKKTLGL